MRVAGIEEEDHAELIARSGRKITALFYRRWNNYLPHSNSHFRTTG
jgi:hypothetical protein